MRLFCLSIAINKCATHVGDEDHQEEACAHGDQGHKTQMHNNTNKYANMIFTNKYMQANMYIHTTKHMSCNGMLFYILFVLRVGLIRLDAVEQAKRWCV